MTSPVERTLDEHKYGGGNPIRAWLLRRFVSAVHRLLALDTSTVVDIGCGEGHLVCVVLGARRGIHMDIEESSLRRARMRRPQGLYVRGSIYALPFRRHVPNTVLCLEVLEHLDNPEAAIVELGRLAGNRALISVPDEPWFSWASLAGGKHIARLGRHPGHVNAWSTAAIGRLLAAAFQISAVLRPFPWSLFDCTAKRP